MDENTKPINVLAERVWNGSAWHYPGIEALSAELTTLRQRAEAAEKQLAEAKRYGAPVDAVALSFVKDPCTKHNAYWTTSSGACMACRAEDAERRVAELEGAILAAEERGRWQEIEAMMKYADERRLPLATAGALLRRINYPHAKAAIDAAGGQHGS